MRALSRKQKSLGYRDATSQQNQAVPRTGGLLTPKEVAVRVKYQSAVSVLRAYRNGHLVGHKLNARTIRFDPDDVAQWLAAARVSNATRKGAVSK